MAFLLRDFFESFIIIFLGGIFILADALFEKRKEELKKIETFRPVRLLFRLIAVFLFTLAAVFIGEDLFYFFPKLSFLAHLLLLLVTASLMTLVTLFFGSILPRFFAESLSSWGPIPALSQCSIRFASWITPLTPFLNFLTTATLHLFGLSARDNHPASNEEVIHMMDEGLYTGVFNASEREMVEGVLELNEQKASFLMTPRAHVVFLNLDDEDEKNWRRIIASGHSEFPVIQGSQDNVVGIVSVKALWANLSLIGEAKLSDVMMPPLYVFSNIKASKIIEEFRMKKQHTALVVDEFGVVEGMITLKDVIESILGMLPERAVKSHYPEIQKQQDGSWLVDAMLHYEEVRQQLALPIQDEEEENRYQTIGGFFLHHLGHVPKKGESISIGNFHLKVFSMSHHRIDKIRINKKC